MPRQPFSRNVFLLILLVIGGVLLFPTVKKWREDPALQSRYASFVDYASESFMTSAPVVKARRFFGQADHAFVSDVRAGEAAAKADAAGH